LRATLRIARRDALRAKGRTALVLAMIGLPVMAIVALVVLLSTTALSPAEALPRTMGQADAVVQTGGRQPVTQQAEGFGSGWSTGGERAGGASAGSWTVRPGTRNGDEQGAVG
jgi:putative ABC transport system permease protein